MDIVLLLFIFVLAAFLGFELGTMFHPAGRIPSLDAYAEFMWQHMSTEEEVVLPLAEANLTPEDWASIDTAFAANRGGQCTRKSNRRDDGDGDGCGCAGGYPDLYDHWGGGCRTVQPGSHQRSVEVPRRA